MTELINFIANTTDFKSVKKMRIVDGVIDKDILEFLVSIQVSTNTQINKLLKKIIDLEVIDLEINNNLEKDIISFTKHLKSNNFEKIIENNLKPVYKKNLKEILDFIKSYALNKYLLDNKLLDEDSVGYYKILYPTRKKQLKKIIKK